MRALITGITGQDGSYLAEFLLEKGYEVYGMVRRSSTETFERINHIRDKINFIHGDLLDQNSLSTIIREIHPDEVYNLAAQSFVPTSWTQPVLTAQFNAVGVTRLLEAIRHFEAVDTPDWRLESYRERRLTRDSLPLTPWQKMTREHHIGGAYCYPGKLEYRGE